MCELAQVRSLLGWGNYLSAEAYWELAWPRELADAYKKAETGSYMIDPALRGRVALVTGANQGIGAAAARALAAEGAPVFLTYLRVDRAGHGDPALPRTYDEVRARSARAGGGGDPARGRGRGGGRVRPRGWLKPSARRAAARMGGKQTWRIPLWSPSCSTGPRRPSVRSRSWSTTRPSGTATLSCRTARSASDGA